MGMNKPKAGTTLQTLEQQSDLLASLLVMGFDASPGQVDAQLADVESVIQLVGEGATALSLDEVLGQSQSLLGLVGAMRGGAETGQDALSALARKLEPLHQILSEQIVALRRASAETSPAGGPDGGALQLPVAEASAPVVEIGGSSYGLADDVELLREFLVEASGHLEAVESGALVLEDQPRDRETLNLLFRAFHSIKGLAGFLEIAAIQRTAHELESLLDLARDGALDIDGGAIDLILETHNFLGDALGRVADRVEGKAAGNIDEDAALLQRIGQYQQRALREKADALSVGSDVAQESLKGAGTASNQDPSLELQNEAVVFGAETPVLMGGGEATEATGLSKGEGLVEVDGPAVPIASVQTTAVQKTAEPAAQEAALPSTDGATERGASAARTSAAGSVVKIDTEKLDYLVDMVGELVIAQSMVRHDPFFETSQSARLLKNMAQMTRVTAEVQRVAMSMRMVPIKGLFQRMSRLARDLARKYDKQVRVELEGEETELDRTLIEQLADPMMHMVRNAIDHGLEDGPQRIAAGKPAEGSIRLSAVHQSGSILISISDNGKGLDRNRILEKARTRGLVSENATLTDAQIDQLIFEPGFSTAAVVSDLSGRGVGMDVVRRNIQQLRGRVEVQSETGKGTTMTMKLPLTLAIIEGLVVGVQGERFIIPLFSVKEMFRADPEAITHVQGEEDVLQVRGAILPVVRLRQRLGFGATGRDESANLCLVVESARSVYCLLVDEFVGKQEVVIKSLGEQFSEIPGIAAGAILGDGTVGLILDMEGIFEGVRTR